MAQHLTISKSSQYGGATLIVSVVLLFILTIATLISHRDSITELRSASNDYRHKQSLSAAQAGAEYALVQLSNEAFAEQTLIDAKKADGTSGTDGYVDPNTNNHVAGLLPEELSFSYSYANLIADDLVSKVKITSLGCADSCGVCSTTCPVKSQITQVVAKSTGRMPMPKGAISARGDVDIQKDDNVSYNSVTTPNPGTLNVVAGGTVAGAAAGTYTQSAPYPGDSGLYTQQILGASVDAMRSVATTITCSICHASDFAGLRGVVYISDPNAKINANGVIGSAEHPLVIISAGKVVLNGTSTIYGFVFGNVEIDVSGTFNMYGAVATPGDYTQKGAGQIQYDQAVLGRLSVPTTYARVMGGWKDY